MLFLSGVGRTRIRRALAIFLGVLPVAAAATFGTVVPLGGHAADLALDEARGVVYVANYTANRIDVVSLKTQKLQTSMNVAPQPSSVALSPDGRYLVVTHLSNFAKPQNAVTVLNLTGTGNVRQTFAFGAPPMGVTFGGDGLALIVTTTEFLLFDPVTGYTQTLGSIEGVTAKELPMPAPNMPRQIIRASVAPAADGSCAYGIVEMNDSADQVLLFYYDVESRSVSSAGWVAQPPFGPRVVSVDRNGSRLIAGWGLFHSSGFLLAQFPNPSGLLEVGSHAIDSSRGLVYAQIATEQDTQTAPGPLQGSNGGGSVTTTPKAKPILVVADYENLAVKEQLKLPENLAGRSVLSADGSMMYSISDSGLMILPVGRLAKTHRVAASAEDVVFRGNWCQRQLLTQQVTIQDPGGNNTDFSLSTNMPGVSLSQTSGTTPAKVTIGVDLNAFQNQNGSTTGLINITSASGVNVPLPVRVVVNNRGPDQRGTTFNVAGKLVDIAADPVRNRFYLLRQDTNQALVFEGTNYRQVATLKTPNTPMNMAVTFDRQHLIVGGDNSQIAYQYNLETLAFERYIVFPFGHYPRSVAASGRAILAASRVAGPKHTIDRVDAYNYAYGYASTLPSLGVWENDIDIQTGLAASPSGAKIVIAQANGKTMLYDANSDTFVAAREDFEKLSGAVAALSDDRFLVDNHLLNGSLVPIQDLETGSGRSSGGAATGEFGLRLVGADPASAGIIQKIDLTNTAIVRPTRVTEAPVLSDEEDGGFTRTLAPLANGTAIVALTTSGFTVLPPTYDAASTDPRINAVVSAADGSSAVAPGGLMSVKGSDLAAVNASTSETPLPTALGDSCMTINGVLVPMVWVSPTQINAQVPVNIAGTATLILHTPGGVSNSFTFNVVTNAPAVFHVPVEGWDSAQATVVRAENNQVSTLSNPVHTGEWIIIYITGLGPTNPFVDSGMPGPADPLAWALMPPSVSLGGVPLYVDYAGLVPGEVGIYQINARVPGSGIPLGLGVPLTIAQGGASTTLNVRVVK